MRRFANGDPWDVVLPYERVSHWSSFGGATYLTDNAILLKLIEVTVSDEEPTPFLGRPTKTAAIDLAKNLSDNAWHDLPRALVVEAADDGRHRYARLRNRVIDMTYLAWLEDTFGPVQFALPDRNAEAPVYFSFLRGWALLMPIGDLRHSPVPIERLAHA